MKIKILLVDDHAVVIRGLSFFLKTQPDFEIVGEASDGTGAIEKVKELQPDIVLMDLVMPNKNGIKATKEILEHFPHVKIIVLTSFSDQDYVLPALRAGAYGYLLKDSQPDQLVDAIRGAMSGNVQITAEISKQLLNQLSSPVNSAKEDSSSTIFQELTTREKEVLLLISQGMSNKEIASTLFIAEKTVKTHVSNILSKLDLQDRTQAALFAVKHGLSLD